MQPPFYSENYIQFEEIVESFVILSEASKIDLSEDGGFNKLEQKISEFVNDLSTKIKSYLDKKDFKNAAFCIEQFEINLRRYHSDLIINVLTDEHEVEKNKIILSETKSLFFILLNNLYHLTDQDPSVQMLGFYGNNISTKKTLFKTLNNKAKILVLKEIGFFDLPKVEPLTLEKRGKLISELLGMDFDNAKDYIGNIYDKKGEAGNKSPYNIQSKKQAKEILSLIGIISNL